MKVCILALDGLEASLVEELNLESLLQKHHGTFSVEAEKYATPALWASFLTGIEPENFDVKFVERNVPRIVQKLRFLKSLRLIGRLVFKPHPPSIKGRYRTIFDHFSRPLPFNVFSYNEEPEQFRIRLKYSLPRTVGNDLESIKAERDWKRLTMKLMSVFLERLEAAEWDLAMTHIYCTDIIGHLFFRNNEKLAEFYGIMDEYSRAIKKSIDGAALLIVSDHGMKRGIHTNYGFWSLNIKPPLKPESITSFFTLLKKLYWMGWANEE